MDDGVKLRKSLSINIKKYRSIIGFSQEKLAESIGLSAQTINDIEGCRKWVSDKTVIKIARALNIEVYQLFLPNNEAQKLFPVKVSSDILQDLKEIIKNDIDRRFGDIVTE